MAFLGASEMLRREQEADLIQAGFREKPQALPLPPSAHPFRVLPHPVMAVWRV